PHGLNICFNTLKYLQSIYIVIPASARSIPFPYTTLFRSLDLQLALSLDQLTYDKQPFTDVNLKANGRGGLITLEQARGKMQGGRDRKSTRLNSSHVKISYAVFCLKKKKIRVSISTY